MMSQNTCSSRKSASARSDSNYVWPGMQPLALDGAKQLAPLFRSLRGALKGLVRWPRSGIAGAALMALASLTPARAADFYVATNGNDSTGTGSVSSPYATVQKAVTASRSAGKAVQKNIIIRGGAYYNVTVLVEQYADANIAFMPYPGEKPILYGGQPLTKWSSAGSNNCYVASLGTFPASVTSSVSSLTTWQPRMLLADGVACTRGRLPATGKYHYKSLSGTTLTYTNNFSSSTNMELLIDKSWSDSEVAAVGINTSLKQIQLDQSVSLGPNTGDVTSFALVNLPEGLKQDNQFCWMKANNTILYKSPGNADPNGKVMIVPTTTRIFWMLGYDVTTCISNIVISNLTFAACNATIGVGGVDDTGENYSSAVRFSNSTNCVVDGCTFYAIGDTAIGNENWTQNYGLKIRNCVIHDVGVGGIAFPGTTGCVISNNIIYNTGLICQCGPGIVGSTYSGKINNNTITNTMGAGIIILTSGYPNLATSSTVSGNTIIHSVRALRDMGAIYTGAGNGQIITGNYIGEINGTNSDNGGVWDPYVIGIYIDEWSINPRVASNIVYNCTRPIMYHRTTNGMYLNNFFVNTRNENTILMLPNSDAPVFQHNVFVSKQAALVDAENSSYSPYSININLAVANWRSNIVWSTSGLNSGNPTNATTADPLFVQMTPGLRSSFVTNSPATKVGIQPITIVNGAITKPATLRVVPQ